MTNIRYGLEQLSICSEDCWFEERGAVKSCNSISAGQHQHGKASLNWLTHTLTLRYHLYYSIIVLSHVFPTLSTTQHWYWIILSQNLVGGIRENSETTRMTANFWLWAENRTSNNRWEQTSTHEQPSVVIVLVHRRTPNSAAAVPTPSGSTDSTGVEGLSLCQSCKLSELKHQFLWIGQLGLPFWSFQICTSYQVSQD